jgi:hypothetical protein
MPQVEQELILPTPQLVFRFWLIGMDYDYWQLLSLLVFSAIS